MVVGWCGRKECATDKFGKTIPTKQIIANIKIII